MMWLCGAEPTTSPAETEQLTQVSPAGTERPTKVSQAGTEQPTQVSPAGTDQPTQVSSAGTEQPTQAQPAETGQPTQVLPPETGQPTQVPPAETEQCPLDDESYPCWICFQEDEKCLRVCRCPRKVHKKCLAQWQLHSVGTEEEKKCRFCSQPLPDWKPKWGYKQYFNAILGLV